MLDLFTVVWGKMVESFLTVTVPSLIQPDNIPKARELLGDYTIYTDPETKTAIMQSELYERLAKDVEVSFEPLQKGKWEINSNILFQMKKSKPARNYMLIISPDLALGDKSLFNMAEICSQGKFNPVLYGLPRLTEAGYEILKARFRERMLVSNRELVSLASRYAEQTNYRIETPIGERHIVSNNTWEVFHNVPTPCLLPDKEIIEIFAANPTLNWGYDHVMPYILVEEGYPWHLIDHSDICFQVERGRHLIGEKVLDSVRWQADKALKGLWLFAQQRQIWQGV